MYIEKKKGKKPVINLLYKFPEGTYSRLNMSNLECFQNVGIFHSPKALYKTRSNFQRADMEASNTPTALDRDDGTTGFWFRVTLPSVTLLLKDRQTTPVISFEDWLLFFKNPKLERNSSFLLLFPTVRKQIRSSRHFPKLSKCALKATLLT